MQIDLESVRNDHSMTFCRGRAQASSNAHLTIEPSSRCPFDEHIYLFALYLRSARSYESERNQCPPTLPVSNAAAAPRLIRQ